MTERYRLLSGEDLDSLPPMEWIIRGVLPRYGLASIYGPSGSGKSFLALDLAAAIVEGRPWFGYKIIERLPVVYLALEGAEGFRMRTRAWAEYHQRPLPADLRIVTESFSVAKQDDMRDLVHSISQYYPDGCVCLVDTLNRATSGADENTSRDMGQIITAFQWLSKSLNGPVIPIHHTGKELTRGARGHSSFFAALDAAIEVKRHDGQRSWQVAKAKDGLDSEEYKFRLEMIELGEWPDGEPMESCVVIPDQGIKMPKLGNIQNQVLTTLQQSPDLTRTTLIEVVKDKLTHIPPHRRREKAARTVDTMLSKGALKLTGSVVSILLPIPHRTI